MMKLTYFAKMAVYNALNNKILYNLNELPKKLYNEIQDIKPCCISLYNARFKNEQLCCDYIGYYNHPECVGMALQMKANGYDIFEAAIFTKNYLCIQALIDHNVQFPEWITVYAAGNGDYELLQFAIANKCRMHPDSCVEAATMGKLECLKLCHLNGCALDLQIIDIACQYNDVEILKYCFENGNTSDALHAALAAEYDSLDCLKYIYENNMPWDSKTPASAAAFGNLECLKFAHEHGCPWDKQTIIRAHLHYRPECIEYAITNGCPLPDHNDLDFNRAI